MFSRKGFTLIEVLVVISIIGILSAIIYANFGEARVEAKNKAFKSELKEVQLALEVYKSQNGKYPTALADLVPDFIAELPVAADSANSNCGINYDDGSGAAEGTYFKLTAARCHGGATDAASGVQTNDELARCPSTCNPNCNGSAFNAAYKTSAAFYESYAVYSYGGQCL